MESKMIKLAIMVVLVVLSLGAAEGFRLGSVGTEPSTLCNMSQDGFMACKPWVTGSAPPVNPSAACCTALSAADLTCLCSYRNSMVLPALGIDPNLAMQLPKKCNLVPPPQC